MFTIPDTEKKLRTRISSYKSALNKEKRTFGHVNDGGGKRYLLFPLYFVLGDMKRAAEYFDWYAAEFDDDVGEPIQKLCWALGLHRMGRDEEARRRLADLMLTNLYMIPHVLGRPVEPLDIWHASNDAELDYVEYLPDEVQQKIAESELAWVADLYDSPEFARVRERHIDIYRRLPTVNDRGERRALLDEADTLIDSLK
jgi:hypothetical protein